MIATTLSCSARAEDDAAEQACLAAFQSTQELRRDGKLVAARADAIACGQSQCAEILSGQCKSWVGELDAAIPSIVVAATSADGSDTSEVRVSVDGAVIAERLEGRAIELDPGQHVLRFEHAGASQEQRLVLTEGEKSRRVEVSFATKAAPAPVDRGAPRQHNAPVAPVEEGGTHALVYVGFALGGAALVVGAISGGVALSKGSDIEDSCPQQRCTEAQRDDYDSGLALAHVSTASFVVAGVGAVLGIVGVALSGGDAHEAAALRPIVGPGFVGVRGGF